MRFHTVNAVRLHVALAASALTLAGCGHDRERLHGNTQESAPSWFDNTHGSSKVKDVWPMVERVARATAVSAPQATAAAKYIAVASRGWQTYDQVAGAIDYACGKLLAEQSSNTRKDAVLLLYQEALRLEPGARHLLLMQLWMTAGYPEKAILRASIRGDLLRTIVADRAACGMPAYPTPPRGDFQRSLRDLLDTPVPDISSDQFRSLARVLVLTDHEMYVWLAEAAKLAPFAGFTLKALAGQTSGLDDPYRNSLLWELSSGTQEQRATWPSQVYDVARTDWHQWEQDGRIGDLERKFQVLEARVGSLEESVRDLRARVETLERWRDWVEAEMLATGKLSFEPTKTTLSADQQHKILQRLAPVFVTDNLDDFPVIAPSEFARMSSLVHCSVNRHDFPGALPSSNPFAGQETLRALVAWLDRGEDTTQLALRLTNASCGNVLTGARTATCQAWNRQSMAAGKGVLGSVRDLGMGDTLLCIQYYLFLMGNVTAASPILNHEGDWLCIDFVIDKRNLENPVIKEAIFHNHGRQLYVDPAILLFSYGHPLIFLEHGSNEPWPNPGSRGFRGYPEKGLRANKVFAEGEWYDSEHKIAREHSGNGFAYYTAGWVVDVLNDSSLDARLVREFRGTWGGRWKDFEPSDDIPVIGPVVSIFVDDERAESPTSPIFQAKMYGRNFERAWLFPPQTMVQWPDIRHTFNHPKDVFQKQ